MTSQYVVDALSWTEAESTIINELSALINGEFEIKEIKKANYKEVFFSDSQADDKFYRMKVAFITYDEKTDDEKRTLVNYLLQAHDFNDAIHKMVDVMSHSMVDYTTINASESKIEDVFDHKDIINGQYTTGVTEK